MTTGCTGPYGLFRATLLLVSSSIGGDVRRSSSSALGKVCLKAFLTANHIITYIDKTIVRLLMEYGSLILNRSHTLYDTAISYYSSVDLYSPALIV